MKLDQAQTCAEAGDTDARCAGPAEDSGMVGRETGFLDRQMGHRLHPLRRHVAQLGAEKVGYLGILNGA